MTILIPWNNRVPNNLDRLAQIVYGYEAWVYESEGKFTIYWNDYEVEKRGFESREAVVAYLVIAHAVHKKEFLEILEALGKE